LDPDPSKPTAALVFGTAGVNENAAVGNPTTLTPCEALVISPLESVTVNVMFLGPAPG